MDYQTFTQHIVVPRGTFDALAYYVAQLEKWQSRLNLISPNTVPDIWHRHILDSCQFYPHLVPRGTMPVADFGSGAGLPGLVLAILGIPNLHLIESDQRKAVFLQEIVRALELPATIHATRIEQTQIARPGAITARGCAPLTRLLSLAYPFLCENTICYFAKGKNYATEITEAQQHWVFRWQAYHSNTDPQAALLAISDIALR